MIIKLTYKTETHLYNKSITYAALQDYVRKAFKSLPKSYSLIYQSNSCEITYIESDQDLIGLKYCCSASNDFMIKINILENRSRNEESYQQMTKNIITINLHELGHKVINKIQDEIAQQEVSKYLTSTFDKVATKVAKQEQDAIIHNEVEIFLNKLTSKTALKQAQKQFCILKPKPSRKRVVHFSPQKHVQEKIYKIQKKSLDSLINERIMQIIPKIVDNVFNQFQKKLKSKCFNCIKKQEELEYAINYQIQQRMKILGARNPQDCEI